MEQPSNSRSITRLTAFLVIIVCLLFSSLGLNNISPVNAQNASDGTPTSSQPHAAPLKSAGSHTKPIPSQAVIRFKPTASEQEKIDYIRSFDGVVKKRIVRLNAWIVRLPQDLTTLPAPDPSVVAGVEQDFYMDALESIPNDPHYGEQWALQAIGAPSAWLELPANAPQITVAVIDSGVCASHPDLAGRIVSGWDFLESDAVPQDDFGHGCAVAGVIAANMNDGVGIAGVAPNAQVMPLRVLNASGIGSYSDVSAAIVYAADNGAQIINLSLGGSNPSPTLESAVNYAIGKGVILVAAAGNNGTEGVLYPAAYPSVIAVGSIDSNLQHSSFSNHGPQVDIWAPGRDILTTKRDGSYGLVSGTSFAAPYVAGAEAMDILLNWPLTFQGNILSLGVPTSGPATPIATPTQIAAGTETLVPTPKTELIIDFDTVVSVPEYLQHSITEGLMDRLGELPRSTFYYSTAFRLSAKGDWAQIVVVPDYVIESGWENLVMDDVIEVLAHYQDSSGWAISLSSDADFSSFSQNLPTDFIDTSAAYTQAAEHRFPWTEGQSWWKNGGWHTGFYGLLNNAIDFQPKSTSSSNLAVLAAAPGLLGTICGPDSGGQMWLKITNSDGTTGYGHLSGSTVRTDLLGKSVGMGQYLGNLFNAGGTFNTPCGNGTATHLHFVLPTTNVSMHDNATNRDVPASEIGTYTPSGQVSYTSNNVRVDNANGNTCTATTTSLPSGYTKCAEEGSGNWCNFNGTLTVYYGSENDGCFDIENKTGSVECTNNSFGGDPLSGVHKACYVNNPPPPTCPQLGGVILYWNANYDCGNGNGDAGYRMRSGTGWQNVIDGAFNDKASSVRVPSGWSVMLYENADRGGAKVCYNTDISDFGQRGNFPNSSVSINDQVSSIEVFNNNNCGGALTPSAPSLSTPGNGSSNAYNYDLNFQWNSVSGATEYQIEWWGGPYSYMQPCGWNGSTSCHVGAVTAGNTYYWHVRARNGYGTSDWSSTWTFTIQPQPTAPSAPALGSPGNGSSNPYNYNPVFQWNSVSGATEYLLEWWGGPYSYMQPCGWNGSTSCSIGTISPGNTYSWHVRARNGYGTGDWSPIWTFTIQPAPLPDLVPFPRPGASDPVVVSRRADSPYTETLFSGQTAYYYWGYKNIGSSNAGTQNVQVFVDNWKFVDYPFGGSNPGGGYGFDNWAEGFYVAPGPHTVRIIVDANNAVQESDETNNIWTGTVYWRDPTVQVNHVFTTDDLGPAQLGQAIPAGDATTKAYKDTFSLGDSIRLYMDFTNEFLDDRTFTCEWQVVNPAGRVVPELADTATTTLGPGEWWWGRDHVIPTNGLRGQYTFIGKITYNGITTTQSTTFTVAGTPAVEVYDVFVMDANGNAASLNEIPQQAVPSEVQDKSVPTFNAGESIQLTIDTYNDVADDEIATFTWEVIDPWGRSLEEMYWDGDLTSSLGNTWWYLPTTIPSHAITGDYTFTGYITYNGRTTQQSQVFHVNGTATPPSNDGFASPLWINDLPYANFQDTWAATVALTDPTSGCGFGRNANSVWYAYTPPANGVLEVDTWGSDYDTVLAVWTGSLFSPTLVQCNDDAYGYVESWLRAIPVTAGTTYYIEVMDYDGVGGGFLQLYVDFAAGLSNDDFSAPITISEMPYTALPQNTAGATKASDDPALTACNRLPGEASVWYKYTPTLSGKLDLDTIGSSFDTMLALWTGNRDNLTLIGCNDDIGDVDGVWDQDSILTDIALVGGTTYYIEVSSFAGMINVDGASTAEAGKGLAISGQNATNLQDLKTAVEIGKASVEASQGRESDELSAQFLGGQMQLNAAYHPAPRAFNKSTPANGVTYSSNSVVLSWKASSDLTGYEYCYYTTNPADCLGAWTPTNDTSFSLSGLPVFTTYYWQVRAVNPNGTTLADNGTWWSFTTAPSTTTKTFYSTFSQDGWVLETTELGNIGRTINSTATTLLVGDDTLRRQYRSILSFNTSNLPDNAVLTKVSLKVKKQGIVGGGNPVSLFQGFLVDIKNGKFGTYLLEASDWQAAANKTLGPFSPVVSSGWYTFDLTNANIYVNKLTTSYGLTQIRLRFKLDDNNNAIANYLSLYSGNAGAASAPQLIIEYYVP